MITIYCGDNTVQSRQAYRDHVNKLSSQSIQLTHLNAGDISSLPNMIHGTAALFSEKEAYVCENVLSRKQHRDLIADLDLPSDIELIIWDGHTDERTIQYAFKNANVKVSKLPSNMWKFLDMITPGKAAHAIRDLELLLQSVDIHMLLYMLQRRIKDLILAESDLPGKKKLAAWQLQNMKRQSAQWGTSKQERLKNLHRMYEKLYDVERGVKTSSNPYELKKALEIVFSFYLQ